MVMFASKDNALARKAICSSCPSMASLLCKECNCLVVAKVRLNYASCPLGKWGQVAAELEKPWDVDNIVSEK